jgi:aryl-alcohol dehydrogenase-like predicted oxidoreductase
MRRPDTRIVLGLHRSRHERGLLESALDLGVRNIDTAFNYADFRSHAILARVAPDLLPHFSVSTKVGFFPGAGDRNDHSLEPARLTRAVETAAETLGIVPDVVFLHNPERSLRDAEPRENDHDDAAAETASSWAVARLEAASTALADAVNAGLCRSWGISTWNPHPLLAAVTAAGPPPSGGFPLPRYLMHRCGLLVPARTSDASDELARAFGIPTERRWGMSPFGGDAADSVWRTVALRPLMAGPPTAADVDVDVDVGWSTVAAAFRLAYALPPVGRVAVGTDRPEHLGELVRALDLGVNEGNIARFRQLLARREAHAAG